MTLIDLTANEAHDLIEGEPVPGRADLRRVRELTAFLRAAAEAEPAPLMRDDLVRLLDLDGLTSN